MSKKTKRQDDLSASCICPCKTKIEANICGDWLSIVVVARPSRVHREGKKKFIDIVLEGEDVKRLRDLCNETLERQRD